MPDTARLSRIALTAAILTAAGGGAAYWARRAAPEPPRAATPAERTVEAASSEAASSPFGDLRGVLRSEWLDARAPEAPRSPLVVLPVESPAAESAPAETPPLPSDKPQPLDFDAPLPAPRPRDLAAEPPPPTPPARPRDLPTIVAALPPPAAPPAPGALAPAAYAPATLTPTEDKPVLTPPPEPSGEFRRGGQVFIRIYKKESELEVWMRKGGRFALYRSFPICAFSGKLGPKVKQGDHQAPEGFYNVSARQLNPKSAYHLSFNVGFPNALERQKRWSGSALMVHGDCKSVGCYAMTNKGIEEIYALVEGALRGGQREVPVHIFPFKMTQSNIESETKGGFFSRGEHAQWADFWRNLKEGHDIFEQTREPPQAYACAGRYAFNGAGRACARIAGW